MTRILLLEDEGDLAAAVSSRLRAEGMAVDVARTLAEGRRLAAAVSYDAFVLDRRLPDGDGLALGREHPDVPALVLTASDDDGSATHQMTKPFSTERLMDAIRALLEGVPPVVELGPLRIETGRRQVRREGVLLPLTRAEYTALLDRAIGSAAVPEPLAASLRRKVGPVP